MKYLLLTLLLIHYTYQNKLTLSPLTRCINVSSNFNAIKAKANFGITDLSYYKDLLSSNPNLRIKSFSYSLSGGSFQKINYTYNTGLLYPKDSPKLKNTLDICQGQVATIINTTKSDQSLVTLRFDCSKKIFIFTLTQHSDRRIDSKEYIINGNLIGIIGFSDKGLIKDLAYISSYPCPIDLPIEQAFSLPSNLNYPYTDGASQTCLVTTKAFRIDNTITYSYSNLLKSIETKIYNKKDYIKSVNASVSKSNKKITKLKFIYSTKWEKVIIDLASSEPVNNINFDVEGEDRINKIDVYSDLGKINGIKFRTNKGKDSGVIGSNQVTVESFSFVELVDIYCTFKEMSSISFLFRKDC